MSEEDEVKDRLELALKASNEGVWDWDLQKDEIFYSNRVLRFLGYGRHDVPNIFLVVWMSRCDRFSSLSSAMPDTCAQ